MEFTSVSDSLGGSNGTSVSNSLQNSPAPRILPNQKATICGECTVVEDVDQEPPVAPVDRLVVPGDIVEIKPDDEQIFIIGTKEGKVTKIRGLEVAKGLKVVACALGLLHI